MKRAVFVFASLALLAAVAQPLLAAPATANEPLLVAADDVAGRAALQRGGGRLLADYGSFSLWSATPEAARAARAKSSRLQSRPQFRTIPLRGGAIDTTAPAAAVPADMRQARTTGGQLWMVQFVGPVKDAWLDELARLGLRRVAYMPWNAYVVWGAGAQLERLDALAASGGSIQWTGPYHPAYRLSPALTARARSASATELVDATVQLYTTKSTPQTLARLLALGGTVRKQVSRTLELTNVTLQLPAGALLRIASWPEVFNIEAWQAPRRFDEVQNQIVAGNVSVVSGDVVPANPGYLAFLASLAFPTTPVSYPLVDIVDDGIDDGSVLPLHPDFHELGGAANPSRLIYNSNCTADAAANGVGGHGNLNAGIVGSYNALVGAPHQDPGGYSIGLGMVPHGRLGGTKIFQNAGFYDISACGGTDAGVVLNSYVRGALITSDSWGTSGNSAYDATAQAYDALTRDAAPGIGSPGNQQMLHVFAAGNDGPDAGTIGSPGTAKNVLTVGATENVREDGILDGCGFDEADDADDLAIYSSRGPADDGRVKPDIVAPGSHVQGPASQDAGFLGGAICGDAAPPSPYHPAGQTLYTWSSGTSHSTPAMAGAAALVREYYLRTAALAPSPAMTKALLVSSARYLDGDATGGTLPSLTQGWGASDLALLFDGGAQILVDETVILGDSGATHSVTATVASPAQPLRVALAWTDAPGSTTGSAWVNDLDLEVVAGGNLYRGNSYDGEFSAVTGTADLRNNIESVSLPPGISGSFTVRVVAANIAADGVPETGDAIDQDFALVIDNASAATAAVIGEAGSLVAGESCAPPNSAADPAETVTVSFALQNFGNANTVDVEATLEASGGVTSPSGPQSYGPLAAGGGAVARSFIFTVSPTLACGDPIVATLSLSDGITPLGTAEFELTAGALSAPIPGNYSSGALSTPLLDNTAVDIPIVVGDTGFVDDVDAQVRLSHTWDSDVLIALVAPDGTRVVLSDGNGFDGQDYGSGSTDCSGTFTVFDDEAATAIGAGLPPYNGSFIPDEALSAFDGKPVAGTWIFEISDTADFDEGTIHCVQLDIARREPTCCVTSCAGETVPPAVTAPAPLALSATTCVAGSPAVTPAGSAALTAWLAAATGSDNCDPAPTMLAARIAGVDVTPSTPFPVGTTTVSFRFVDSEGNIGSATSTATVSLFYGDYDQDGGIDAVDLVLLANLLVANVTAGTPPFTAPLGAADLDLDSGVDATDLVIHANRLVGNIACVPI